MQDVRHLVGYSALINYWEGCFVSGRNLKAFGVKRASISGELFGTDALAAPIRFGAALSRLRGLQDTLQGDLFHEASR